MKKLMAGIIVPALMCGTTQAGQIQNWPTVTLTLNDASCITQFNVSDEAYTACRDVELRVLYTKVWAEAGCENARNWYIYIKHVEENIPATEEIEVTKLDDNLIKVQRSTLTTWFIRPPTDLTQVCDYAAWSKSKFENELNYLHKSFASKMP